MTIFDILAVAACALAGGMGAYGLVNPGWIAGIVRLTPTEGLVEGRSEFRASFGGLFAASHGFAAWALITSQPGAAMAAAVLGAAWLGASFGRTISLFADGALTRLNIFNVGFEITLGIALLLPLIMG